MLIALTTALAGSENPRPDAPATARAEVNETTPEATPWKTGQPVSIAVSRGRARFDVPANGPGSRTLVIVSALSRASGPFPVRLAARPSNELRAPEVVPEAPHREIRLKPVALPPPPEVVQRLPAMEKTFHLLVRDGDVASASNYLAVQGRLRAVGQRVQVYVDEQDLPLVGVDVLRDLVATFDSRVFPTAAATLGRANDVDRDGRFTVLMSSWLTRLAGGRHAVDGFVRGADFDTTLGTPFSNRCDMMYLSTAMEPGPHLRTVLAHEYTHAVTLCAKAFHATGNGPGRSRPEEEEGWLDEALAHLGEDLHGFSRSNIDYRVSAFLSQPSHYRLVVEDYYAADLFRSHGNRGGTYLFLRWCADRFGSSLLPSLIRSEERGTENLEAATGVPFAELYRQWSVALFLSGLEPEAGHPTSPGYRSLDVRGPLGTWELAGPRPLPVEVTPGGGSRSWSSAGTSSQFVVVEASDDVRAAAFAVDVSGPPEADLQVTALPLPDDMAEIGLNVQVVAGAEGSRQFRARLSERQGVEVRLTSLSWEPLTPAVNPHSNQFHRDGLDPGGIARAFGSTTLPPRGTLQSRPIALPDANDCGVPLVVKLVGTDAGGRRVAAWAEIPASPDALNAQDCDAPATN